MERAARPAPPRAIGPGRGASTAMGVPWWLLRVPLLIALVAVCVVRRTVDHLVVWPVLLLLHYTGIKPYPRIVRT